MPPLHSTLLTLRGHLQFSSRPLDYSSSKKGTVYIIRIHACITSAPRAPRSRIAYALPVGRSCALQAK